MLYHLKYLLKVFLFGFSGHLGLTAVPLVLLGTKGPAEDLRGCGPEYTLVVDMKKLKKIKVNRTEILDVSLESTDQIQRRETEDL